jgi:aspartyl-tRNA(Asn)/glutamyl-tRNA(Gln) amidotransferase subunit C
MSSPAHSVDVAYIATLARLALSEAEQARLQASIAEVLGYVDQLRDVDVTGVEPTAHAAPIYNVWRADAPGATLPQEAVLANAPALIDEALIKVPAVLGDQAESA